MDRFQAVDPDLLGIAPGDRVLDVGCGAGRHTLELSRRPCTVVALDLSTEELRKGRYLLEIMRRRGEVCGEVHLLGGEGGQLPLRDRSFDRVICTETLEHIADDRGLLRELVRVLRPGGVLAVSVPDAPSERLFWLLWPKYRHIPGGHLRIYRRGELGALLRDGGVRPFATRFRHSLETLYWLVSIVCNRGRDEPTFVSELLRNGLNSEAARRSRMLTWLDQLGNCVLPKSIVLYGRKPLEAR